MHTGITTTCAISSKYVGLSFTRSFKSGSQQAKEASTFVKCIIWTDLQFNQHYFPSPTASPSPCLSASLSSSHTPSPSSNPLPFPLLLSSLSPSLCAVYVTKKHFGEGATEYTHERARAHTRACVIERMHASTRCNYINVKCRTCSVI